ncbi:PREDICTED: cyclic nucleotide-gated ion channel 1-like [Fragaria vesca subsp. vesca]
MTAVVENPKEKAVSNADPNLETSLENSTMKSNGKWPTMKEIVDPEGPFIPVMILIFISKLRGSGSFNAGLMNFFILVQYVPRLLRIYLSCKESKTSSSQDPPIWLKGVLNFFMYILASHVLGAMWYFFAIQRITTCWGNACRNANGCDANNFDCSNHHALRNITSLNDLCPIDPENAKLFDFGIYLDILQFGILGSTNYPVKLSFCFWWGLRNLRFVHVKTLDLILSHENPHLHSLYLLNIKQLLEFTN